MKLIHLIGLLILLAGRTYAGTVSGFVIDKENGERIAYSNVIVMGTDLGAITNKEGYFVINKVPRGEVEFFISNIAYSPVKVTKTFELPNSEVFFKVELEKSSIEMEGLTVSGNKFVDEINSRKIVISKVTRTTEDLTSIPQIADADVFRAIQVLPGVTAMSDFSSGLYVRGGSPDQNLILLDDTDVYNPSHFGGIFSTFNTDAIENVELLKGGFPAKYGGRLSSVLDVTNLDGNRKHHQGVARISLISANSTIQGPWAKGSYMASFRRTYIDLVAKIIDLPIPDYYFYDGHAKVTWDVSDKDKITGSTYFGKDRLSIDFGMEMLISWGNETYTTQWVHIFNPQLFSRFVLAGSHFNFNYNLEGENDMEFDMDNDINDYSMKSNFSYLPNEVHSIDFGLEAKHLNVTYKMTTTTNVDDSHLPDIDVSSLTTSAYIQDSWVVGDFWTIQPGLRLTQYYGVSSYLAEKPTCSYFRLSPRFSIRKQLTAESNVFFSYGRYNQYITSMDSGESPLPLMVPIDDTVKPGESDHYIIGYKTQVGEDFAFDIEAYYKNYRNLVAARSETDYEWDNNSGTLSDAYNQGKGFSWGADLMFRTDWKGWEGFIGYGFSLVKKKIKETNLNPETGEEEWYYPAYDRNHQFNVVESYKYTESTGRTFLGTDLSFGMTYSFGSGQPTTAPEQIYYNGEDFTILYGYEDADRLPYYSRFDISIKFKKQYANWSFEPYLQIINVFDHENVWNRSFQPELSEGGVLSMKTYDTSMFPRIPFIGFNIEW